MKDVTRLLQLQKLHEHRTRIALMRQMAARETQSAAHALAQRVHGELGALKTTHTQFVLEVLDRSKVIANPSARIAGIARQLRSQHNLIENTAVAAHRADDNHTAALHGVTDADQLVKTSRISQDRLNARVQDTLRAMQIFAELRDEDDTSETVQATHTHKTGIV